MNSSIRVQNKTFFKTASFVDPYFLGFETFIVGCYLLHVLQNFICKLLFLADSFFRHRRQVTPPPREPPLPEMIPILNSFHPAESSRCPEK